MFPMIPLNITVPDVPASFTVKQHLKYKMQQASDVSLKWFLWRHRSDKTLFFLSKQNIHSHAEVFYIQIVVYSKVTFMCFNIASAGLMVNSNIIFIQRIRNAKPNSR